MDALSSLAASSAVTATATASSTGSSADSSTTANVPAPTESARTFFSDFARNLLAHQASNPTQSIDAAMAKNMLSPSLNYSVGGRLYTSAGFLQQFATDQFVSRLQLNQDSSNSSSSDSSSDSSGSDTFGLSAFSNNGGRALLNFINSYQQISLLGGLSNLASSLPPKTSNPFANAQPVVTHTATTTNANSSKPEPAAPTASTTATSTTQH